jgi:hypothetical protein
MKGRFMRRLTQRIVASRTGPKMSLGLLACCLLAACSSPHPGRPADKEDTEITELNVFSAPVAVNFDGIPGPDGLSLRIYAGNPRDAKRVAITSGKLEILLFLGLVRGEEIISTKPWFTWDYPTDRLARCAQRTSVGVSYVVTPLWAKEAPATNRVTCVVRYVRPTGSPLYSSPVVIFVNPN